MPFCTNCGSKLNDSAKFCENCGKPVITNFKTNEEYIGEKKEVTAPPYSPAAQAVPKPEKKKNGLKVFLWIIASLFSVIILFLISVFVWAIFDILKVPDDTLDYNLFETEEWIHNSWESGETSILRNFSSDTVDNATLTNNIDTYLNDWWANSYEFTTKVYTWTYAVTDNGKYQTVEISFEYPDEYEYDYDLLPRFDTEKNLLIGLNELMEQGQTEFLFLVGKDLTEKNIMNAAKALTANTSDFAVESSSYLYNYVEKSKDEYNCGYISLTFDIDEAELNPFNAELRNTFSSIADEIKEKGITDTKELYREVAKTLAQRVKYDDDTKIATYTDSLSDEQKMLRTAYGAVIKGETVCSGYALAFKGICDRLGLKCWVVHGYLEDGAHAWNMIEVDGEILYADVTSFDVYQYLGDEFLFMNDATLDRYNYYMSENLLCPWLSENKAA